MFRSGVVVMMRRAVGFACVACLGTLTLAGLPVAASAAPTVIARAAVVPIPKNLRTGKGPTWPGTGNILGAPAALELEGKIKGTEFGGFPSPLKQIKIFLPKGTRVNQAGFATCSEGVLHDKGAGACPLRSFASPPGEANGVVSFGGSLVHERVTVQGFFNQGGGLIFSIVGNSPVALEEFSTATYENTPNGVIGTAEIPLIETVPGAQAASAEQFKVKLGAAYMSHGKLHSFGTVPKTCHRKLSGKYEVTFYSGETVSGEVSVPCPRR